MTFWNILRWRSGAIVFVHAVMRRVCQSILALNNNRE